jgi:hypothetical protein
MPSRLAALALAAALLAAGPARADEAGPAAPAAPPAPAAEPTPPSPPAPAATPEAPAARHARCRHCAHRKHARRGWHAARGPSDWVLLRGGAFLAESGDLATANTGFGGELAAGRSFLPFLAGELSAGAFFVDGDAGSFRIGTTTVAAKQSFRDIPVAATLKLVLPRGTIRPHLLAGAGIHIGSFTRDPTGAGASAEWEDTWFSTHVGAGATWRATRRLFVEAEGRYTFATARVFNEAVSLEGFRATAGLGWRF